MNRRRALQSMKHAPAAKPRPVNNAAPKGPAKLDEDDGADMTGQDEQDLQEAAAHKICDVGSCSRAAAAAADAEAPARKRVKRATAALTDAPQPAMPADSSPAGASNPAGVRFSSRLRGAASGVDPNALPAARRSFQRISLVQLLTAGLLQPSEDGQHWKFGPRGQHLRTVYVLPTGARLAICMPSMHCSAECSSERRVRCQEAIR
jgi:hypothetical protein